MAVKAGCDGNFTDGLCCRIVIETKRVFDGCAFTDENITLTLVTDRQIPQDAEFVSVRVTGAEFVDYTVMPGAGGCCRVSGEVVTRFAVTYSSDGSLVTVPAFYREHKEVLLRLPTGNSLVPYAIEVSAVMTVGGGAVLGANAFSVTGCLLQIVKVTACVDVLIPTYGYCKYPPCTGCICPGLRDSNIFPTFGEEIGN